MSILSLFIAPDVAEPFLGVAVSGFVTIAVACTGMAISIAVIYLTFRQLRLIRRTYQRATQLNLFQSRQLYAFSGLTLRTGIGWLIIIYSALLAYPMLLRNPIWSSTSGLVIIAVAISFVWTLLDIQQRIGGEKARILDVIDLRLEDAFTALHRSMNAADLDGLARARQIVESLLLERGGVAKIPSWPWQPGTLASFLTAISLPLIVWLIQRLFQRLAGL